MIASAPNIALNRARIPKLLKNVNRWLVWRAGHPKPNGKFDKVPIDPNTGRNINGTDSANWMSFEEACATYDAGLCSGIGFALCDKPIASVDGIPLYLAALDYDHCADKMDEIRRVHKALGKSYVEISPSGAGIRMFALSDTPICGGNAGNGREIYGNGRFMTVTGHDGRGDVVEATAAIQALLEKWFPKKSSKLATAPPMLQGLTLPQRPEVPLYVDQVKSQLSCVSADCSYEDWTRIIWSVLSTGWQCAVGLVEDWSRTAPDRYDQKALDTVVASFDASKGITLGTLFHHATSAGWTPVVPASIAPATTTQKQATDMLKHGRLLTAAELVILPSLHWRIKGLLPAKGIASIYGLSGSGKTFAALDMACAVSSGRSEWFGHKVKGAPVAYVALEGTAGLQQRLKAWEGHNQQAAPADIRFVLGGFTLLESHHATELANDVLQTLESGAVVFIDTLNQSAPGADENSSVDMGIVISNAKVLAEVINGLVILVHHSGKDQGKGMRGHSSLHAAMDAVIEVVSNANGRAWRVTKSKDGESGAAHGFELVSYKVGQDEDGDEIRSCAIRPTLLSTSQTRKPPTGKNQLAALQQLCTTRASHPGGVLMSDAIQKVAPFMSGPDNRKSSRAKEVIGNLVASGHLELVGDRLLIE